MEKKQSLLLWAGPAFGLIVWAVLRWQGLSPEASSTAGVTALCAFWWVTEPVPIPVTSLIPFAAFPLTGVLSHKQVATAYGHTLILLLMGGFIISMAMEKSGTHRRLALNMVRMVGGGGRRLVLGFMLATAVLSMWISNTATTLMLLPVALAVIEKSEDQRIAVPLMLGIAYGASIGGLGTPVGTPPNVIFMGVYSKTTGQEMSFLAWMKIGIPAVCVMLPVAWLVLVRNLKDTKPVDIPHPGPWRPAEVRVLLVFGMTALAWILRTAPFGGWKTWLDMPGAGDSTVALIAVVVMFLIPDGEGDRLLDWPTARKIPWGLLLLFGGGIAIAKAFGASGLSKSMASLLSGLTSWPVWLMILVICLSVTFLTEITSNTATTTLLMPVLAAAGVAASIDPRLLMIPAALSASCAFMLPVATAPNAIVFGSGHVSTQQMAREGILINLAGTILLTIVCYFLL